MCTTSPDISVMIGVRRGISLWRRSVLRLITFWGEETQSVFYRYWTWRLQTLCQRTRVSTWLSLSCPFFSPTAQTLDLYVDLVCWTKSFLASCLKASVLSFRQLFENDLSPDKFKNPASDGKDSSWWVRIGHIFTTSFRFEKTYVSTLPLYVHRIRNVTFLTDVTDTTWRSLGNTSLGKTEWETTACLIMDIWRGTFFFSYASANSWRDVLTRR